MSCPAKPGTRVFSVTTRVTKDAPPDAINLLDGQQRTLAILSAWPGIENQLQRPVSVWIDLAEKPQGEYRFRLLATTRAQPFGYERASMGGQSLSKLVSRERRLANSTYLQKDESIDAWNLWDSKGFMPWNANLAMRLSVLIGNPDSLDSVDTHIKEKINFFENLLYEKVNQKEPVSANDDYLHEMQRYLQAKINNLKKIIENENDRKDLNERVNSLREALRLIPEIQFPLIPIGRHLDEKNEAVGDPTIAVLFKRVGSGGQSLSDEDYIFSVIKHHAPAAHDLVEELMDDRVSALYSANDLVMAAVRLSLFELRSSASGEGDRRVFADRARINKAEFARLIRRKQPGEKWFINLFEESIKASGRFTETLRAVLSALAYSGEFRVGLPKHAFWSLIDRHLLDVLLAFTHRVGTDWLEKSRLKVTRFILWGKLCIIDKQAASEQCIRAMDEMVNIAEFPEGIFIERLLEKKLAYALPSPDILLARNLKGLVRSDDLEDGDKGLRGWSRFVSESYPDLLAKDHYILEVYRRWWDFDRGYHHPFLLWLQREFVFYEFEKKPALAGLEDETPYDFDHILPQSHWGQWTGAAKGNRLIDFHANGKLDSTGHNTIGNGLGNVRIWPSGSNRSDSDSAPVTKLLLEDPLDHRREKILDDSNIKETQPWVDASYVHDLEHRDDPRYWDKARVLAFQGAVEARTFLMYKQFYEELGFIEVQPVFAMASKVLDSGEGATMEKFHDE